MNRSAQAQHSAVWLWVRGGFHPSGSDVGRAAHQLPKYCVRVPRSQGILNNAILTHLRSVCNINPICKYQIQVWVCMCHVANSISGVSHFHANRFKNVECKKSFCHKKVGKALPSP